MNDSVEGQEPDETSMDAVLKRYLEIQKQEQSLKEEKAELQTALGVYMTKIQREQWYPDLDGQKLNVRCRESTSIEYNEELLQQRLADRYSSLLEPDIRKIRKSLKDVSPLLQPMIDRIGSPSAGKVRSAIEAGVVQKEEFAGAFEKTTKRNVSVMRMRMGNSEN